MSTVLRQFSTRSLQFRVVSSSRNAQTQISPQMVRSSGSREARFLRFLTGNLPFLSHGLTTISTYESIVKYVKNSKFRTEYWEARLDGQQRAQHTAWLAFVQAHLGDLVVSTRTRCPHIISFFDANIGMLVLYLEGQLLKMRPPHSRQRSSCSSKLLCTRSYARTLQG